MPKHLECIENIEQDLKGAQNPALSIHQRKEHLEQAHQGVALARIVLHSLSSADKTEVQKQLAALTKQLSEVDSQLPRSPKSVVTQHGLYAPEQEDQSLRRLKEAHKQLLMAEEDGKATIQNLGIQREQLKHVKANLKEVDQEVDESSSLLNRMQRRSNCSVM
jgi:endonuclease IV